VEQLSPLGPTKRGLFDAPVHQIVNIRRPHPENYCGLRRRERTVRQHAAR
jgi:hypothetical protein